MRYSALISIALFVFACSSSKTTDLGNPDVGTIQDNGVDVPPEIGGDVRTDPGHVILDSGQTDKGNPVDNGTDIGTDTDAGNDCPSSVVTGNTCAEVGACLLACDDSTYQDQCKSGSQTTAVAAFKALTDCAAQMNCGPVFTGEWFSQCVLDKCETEYGKCFVNAAADAKTCQDIRSCRMDCPAGDPTCPIKCIAQGSAEAQTDYFKYVDCLFNTDCVKNLHQLNSNGWPMNSCEKHANNMCSNYWTACMKPN